MAESFGLPTPLHFSTDISNILTFSLFYWERLVTFNIIESSSIFAQNDNFNFIIIYWKLNQFLQMHSIL